MFFHWYQIRGEPLCRGGAGCADRLFGAVRAVPNDLPNHDPTRAKFTVAPGSSSGCSSSSRKSTAAKMVTPTKYPISTNPNRAT